MLTDGRKITVDLVRQMTDEELAKIQAMVGDERYAGGHYRHARELFDRLVAAETFKEFLTLPGLPIPGVDVEVLSVEC